ncbi:hypothetical protein ZIOFF_046054 [Zingiber officinale]|uniref:BED-type domain-containing protein n=1 Tax=Zingiber officinale TaxID=94328 RepID=A0A8J5L265_ZINOF|nr:hypothetical protein ZIOFF_046054 [Zingiber officinale]
MPLARQDSRSGRRIQGCLTMRAAHGDCRSRGGLLAAAAASSPLSEQPTPRALLVSAVLFQEAGSSQNVYWSRSTVSSAVICMPSDIESYCCSSTPNMSTRNTLSAQESSTTPVMGGVQASTNDINEASQSEDVTDNNEDEENNPYCRKKRKRTSPVWTDFKQITLPDGKMKAECIHCKHRLSITTSGCTSHLNRHSAGCVRRQMNTTGQKNISIITSISESETVSVV